MPTCKEISRAVASDELATASWKKRLAAKLHLLMCRHCRRYARQMQRIGEAAKDVFIDQPTMPESRNRLRGAILDQIHSSEQSDSDPGV